MADVPKGIATDPQTSFEVLATAACDLRLKSSEIATVTFRPAQRIIRIMVLVSHRFSTVRMADLIVVLDGARIAELGTHEELMISAGQYAQPYKIQAAAYR